MNVQHGYYCSNDKATSNIFLVSKTVNLGLVYCGTILPGLTLTPGLNQAQTQNSMIVITNTIDQGLIIFVIKSLF